MGLFDKNKEKEKEKGNRKQTISNLNKTGNVSGYKNTSSINKTGAFGGGSKAQPKQPTSNANVNPSNLAGINYQQKTKENPEKGKTFVPDTKLQSTKGLKKELREKQDVLSSMSDESTEKANKVVDKLGEIGQNLSAWGNFIDKGVDNVTKTIGTLTALGFQSKAKRNEYEKRDGEWVNTKEEKRNEADKKREETVKSITQEDYNSFFNEDGSDVDFDSQIKELKANRRSLQNQRSTLANGKADTTDVDNQIKDIDNEIERVQGLKDKRDSLVEYYTLDELKKQGDEEGYNTYRDQFAYRDASTGERFGLATRSLAIQTANEIPSLADQGRFYVKAKSANDKIDQANEELESGDITLDEYVETMNKCNEKLAEARSQYDSGFSNYLRQFANDYNTKVYYNADDVQKFLVQTGVSTEQFLLHFAMMQMFTSSMVPQDVLIKEGADYVSKEFGTGMAQLLGEDALREYGLRTVAGRMATMSMAGVSMTEKFNQLIESGCDPETAYKNAVLTGIVSWLTETIGMDATVKSLGTSVSSDILGYVLKGRVTAGFLAEGGEEVIEGLVDPIIDAITLGKDYEVNGSELLMEFMMGGVSGGFMSGYAVAQNYISGEMNSLDLARQRINLNEAKRDSTMFYNNAVTGKLVINSVEQLNMARAEMEILDRNLPNMTEEQLGIYEIVKANFDQAVAQFEAKQRVPGVVLAEDRIEVPTQEETNRAIVETETPDFNEEVQQTKTLDSLQEKVDANLEKATEMSQQILDSNGYKIDARAFNQMTEENQRGALAVLDFAKLIGADVTMTDNFDYYKDGEIKNKQMEWNENGVAFDNDKIFINPFAFDFASNSKMAETMEQVFAHELTHTTELKDEDGNLSDSYINLEKAVRSAMGEEAWQKKFEELQSRYGEKANTPEKVKREVVADYVGKNLGNEQFLESLSEYDSSVFARLYTNMKSLVSKDAKVAKEFFKAYNSRIDKAMSNNKPTYVFGDVISATSAEFNLSQYKEKGRYVLVDYLYKQVEKGNLDAESADEIYNTLEFYAEKIDEMTHDPDKLFENFTNWSDVSMTKDHEGYPQLTCVVSNGDYKMNIDFSTVCKKRKVADAVFNELAKEGILDKKALTDKEIARIRQIVKDNKLEVACSLCFVDSKRFNQGGWADTLINGKTDKLNQDLVKLGVQDPKTKHIMGWNEMVDVLANDPSEVGDFNFAGRESVNEGTLHTLSDSEVNQDGLKFLKNIVNHTEPNSEIGRIARALVSNPELRKHMLLGDLYGSSAFGNIKRGNQDLFKVVNTHQGVAKPKSPYMEVTYDNEIIMRGIFDSAKAREVGGVRIQSFSDFMANMVFDYMEMVAELQAKGLTAHSYTKVQDFVELFGMTGIKINMSIIPKATTMSAQDFAVLSDEEKEAIKQYAGLEKFTLEQVKEFENTPEKDKNGNETGRTMKEALTQDRGLGLSEDGSCYTAYIFEDESFDWLTALELQNREGYDRNVGTICVGVSDEHIWKMLSDDNVKMIIPYHKSSLNPMVAHMMNIGAYKDYTDYQNTRGWSEGTWKSLKTLKRADFQFYKRGMMKNGYDAKATATKYIEWCAKKKYLPKFDQFAFVNDENGDWIKNEDGGYTKVEPGQGNLSINEGYYKLLIDFRAYDKNGNLAPQENVRQNYAPDFMEKLKSTLLNYEEMTNEQKRKMPKIVDDVKSKVFEENNAQDNVPEDDGFQFAIGKDDKGTPIFGRDEITEELEGIEGGSFMSKLAKYMNKKYRNHTINMGGVYDARYTTRSTNEFIQQNEGLSGKQKNAKYQTATDLDLLASIATPIDFHTDKKGKQKYYDHFYTEFGIQNEDGSIDYYEGILNIRDNPDGTKRFHTLSELNERETGQYRHVSPITDFSSKDNISQPKGEVNNSDIQNDLSDVKSIPSEIVKSYNKAVKEGDVNAQQKAVRDYAVSQGFSAEQFYHATASEGFNEFDKSKIKALETDADYNGFWVSTDPDTSPSFRDAKKTYPLYIKYGNIAPADVVNKVRKEVKSEWRNPDRKLHDEARSLQDEVRLRLEDLGYNSIVFDDKVDINVDELEKTGETEWTSARGVKYQLKYDQERTDEIGIDAYYLYYWSNVQGDWMWTQEDYFGTPQEVADDINTYRHGDKVVVLFEPNQLKSSAPIEYDDKGNVIPLEKRFGETSDIRYSLTSYGGMKNLEDYISQHPEDASAKEFYDNMKERLEKAEQMQREVENGKLKYTDDEIYEKTGWMLDDKDQVLKGEFYDDGSVDKIYEWTKTQKGKTKDFRNDKTNTKLKDILGDDSLFLKMYPKLADVYVYVSNNPTDTLGQFSSSLPRQDGFLRGDPKRIRIGRKTWDGGYKYVQDPKGNYYDNDGNHYRRVRETRDVTETEMRDTIAHEIQHAIQLLEGFYYGDKEDYWEKPGEKESRKVGSMQTDKSLRHVDERGKMISDDKGDATAVPEELDTGDVETDESTEGLDDLGTSGELENGEGQNEQEWSDTDERDSEDSPDDSKEPIGDLNISDDELGDRFKQKIPTKADMARDETAQILEENPEPEKDPGLWGRLKRKARRIVVDKLAPVVEFADQHSNEKIKDLADYMMTSSGRANIAITKGIFSDDGKTKLYDSLVDILGDLPKKDKSLFAEYMYHQRNIDDMSMQERLGSEFSDKPVFGESVTADESLQRVMEIEEKHPEFKERAEKLYGYLQELLKMQVGGLISQEDFDLYQKMRPHYIPIARDVENGGVKKASTDPNKLILRFKGSTLDILPLETALGQYTDRAYKTYDRNRLYLEIANTIGNAQDVKRESVRELVENDWQSLHESKEGRQLYAYENGQKVAVPIDDEMYKSLTPFKMDNDFEKALSKWAKLVQFRKDLLTRYNPIFGIRNALKDRQDASFNTKYPKSYSKNYAVALAEAFAHKGKYYNQYVNLGGGMNSYFEKNLDLSKAFKQANSNMAKAWKRLCGVQDDIEMVPRLAEFICSLEAGNSVEKAMYDASEVTTNFKRGGTLTKLADRYGVSFLNASVQGFDKHVRQMKGNVKEARKAGVKGMISLLAKLTLVTGVPLRAIQDFAWRNDKDYDELSNYIKDNYYIVWKDKKGRFIRLNKGRIASFYQAVLTNTIDTVKGKKNAWDAMLDDYTSFMDNIAPNNPADNWIGAPIVQTMRNKTWYGDDIVSTTLQQYNDWEQYDEDTDKLSIALGRLSEKVADATGSKLFGLSPKKINYLLDQYSGAIGDVALPALTLKTDVEADGLLKGPATAILDAFTTDPVLKNQNVSDFYALQKSLNADAKDRDATDEESLSSLYMNSVATSMGKLYGEIHDIQGSDLPNKEKMAKTKELRTQINDLARTALATYDLIDMTGDYATVGNVQYYKSDTGWKQPSKEQLKKVNDAKLSDEDMNGYFSTWSNIQDERKEIKDRTPEGKDADYTEATINAISNSNMSYKGKNALLDNYYSSKASDHINKMDLNDEQKYKLKIANKTAEGKKDKNGKTIANSKAEATAEAYRELGLLDTVLKYIKDNNIAPSELGLSKTVYNKLIKGGTYQSAYNSSMGSKSSKSKKSNEHKKSGASSGTTRMNMASKVTSTPKPKVSKNYLKAYSNSFKYTNTKPSSGGSSQKTCPRCGNRVPSGTETCPVCGTRL